MSWHDLDHDQILASPSEVESRRFGLAIGRVVVGQRVTWSQETSGRLAAALDRDEDVLIVRYPSQLATCAGVLAATGRDVLPADSLTYWQASSATVASSASVDASTPEMVRADEVDPGKLSHAVAVAFANYVNHYSANPLLDPALATEGYVDWVARTLRADPENGAVLVSDGEVDAWGMWLADPSGANLEWMLAGVTPRARGRALYGVLMARAGQVAVSRGIPRVVTSTQGANVGIQRVWARAQLLPMADLMTVHLVRRGLLAGSRTIRD